MKRQFGGKGRQQRLHATGNCNCPSATPKTPTGAIRARDHIVSLGWSFSDRRLKPSGTLSTVDHLLCYHHHHHGQYESPPTLPFPTLLTSSSSAFRR